MRSILVTFTVDNTTCNTCIYWRLTFKRKGDEYGGDRGVCIREPKAIKKTSEDGFMCDYWNDEEKKRIEAKCW